MININCEECGDPIVKDSEVVATEVFTVECGLPECPYDIDFGSVEALENCATCDGIILYCNSCWYDLTGEKMTQDDLVIDDDGLSIAVHNNNEDET